MPKLYFVLKFFVLFKYSCEQMVRKSRIKYLLIKELTKFTLFSLITILIISVLQSRSEKIANQFDLNEETQLFYKKNFSHIKNNQEKICPLYPKELGKL